MLSMKANKKLVQIHVAHSSGKNVLLKDLHNMVTKGNVGKNDMETLIKEMKSVTGL